MDNQELENILKNITDVDYVHVEGDGYHHQLTLVSKVFEGLSPVKRQQWVYANLNQYILSGEIHALNMKTWTPFEWEKRRG